MFNHTYYLQQALSLAEQYRGFCAPNPAVGAIVVKDNQILATGYHRGAGNPHAEAEALKQLSPEQSEGAIVYVTLEPCCHYGRTPPCTELLIQHKVKAVYYGFQDPNPRVSGKGEAQLLSAGISCSYIANEEITAFYQSYSYWTQTQRPWVTAKLALSLDGKIAGYKGQRIAITGAELQQYTHQRRKRADAILTTAKTILHDDPQLNVRLAAETYRKPVYVLDSNLSFSPTARLLTTAEKVVVFYKDALSLTLKKQLESLGVQCVPVQDEYGRLSLNQVLAQIGRDGIHDLWVEAGGTCFQSLINQKLAHQALIYVALKWLGETAQLAFNGNLNLDAYDTQWQIIDKDILCELSNRELSCLQVI